MGLTMTHVCLLTGAVVNYIQQLSIAILATIGTKVTAYISLHSDHLEYVILIKGIILRPSHISHFYPYPYRLALSPWL